MLSDNDTRKALNKLGKGSAECHPQQSPLGFYLDDKELFAESFF